jgi:hypothetical protein
MAYLADSERWLGLFRVRYLLDRVDDLLKDAMAKRGMLSEAFLLAEKAVFGSVWKPVIIRVAVSGTDPPDSATFVIGSMH